MRENVGLGGRRTTGECSEAKGEKVRSTYTAKKRKRKKTNTSREKKRRESRVNRQREGISNSDQKKKPHCARKKTNDLGGAIHQVSGPSEKKNTCKESPNVRPARNRDKEHGQTKKHCKRRGESPEKNGMKGDE